MSFFFLYTGLGQPLRNVAAATGNQAKNPEVFDIPNNEYSEAIGAHDCLEMMFYFKFGGAATGDVVIERAEDINFPNNGTTFDTVTVAAERTANWNAGTPLVGFFRIKNTSGQTVKVFCQKRVA